MPRRPTLPRECWSLVALLTTVTIVGCGAPRHFPAPLTFQSAASETVAAFDLTGDHRADYWQYRGVDGRVHALAFAEHDGTTPGPRVNLDQIDPATVPNFLIALDGVPFEVVQQLYDQGSFRLFHRPARLISCFPSMTDLAYSQIFHSPRCDAYQAEYFNRGTNRVTDGNSEYLSGRSAPWRPYIEYRTSFLWDTLVYLSPQFVFHHELDQMAQLFHDRQSGQASGYSVGTAGLGTRGSRPAMEKYLREVDELCERIVYEHRGRVKITLLADHGQNMTPNQLATFDQRLRQGGYNPSRSLHDWRDVVTISFGLVTYADFYTSDPAGVAECLLADDRIEFACYRENNAVVVRNRNGLARITAGAGGYRYNFAHGDPLHLGSVVDQLAHNGKVAPDGTLDEQALFAATVDHQYPDALRRIWESFHGLVANPADLIVNLHDGACHGAPFFARAIGTIASTHGSLNRVNSTTFVMSMLGDLPPASRLGEILPALAKLRGRHLHDHAQPEAGDRAEPISAAIQPR